MKLEKKLPETNPFLRQLFNDISARSPEELGDELIDAISETFAILRAAQMDAILADFRNKMNREDIIIRFYEDFLAAYKPEMREKRGVYYTPEPVVSYMVRSVDELIKDKFDKPLGIADPEVMILDPACGTGTFLLWIFQLIHQRFQENPEALTEGLEDKSWSGYVTERLLPRIFGFELLMAPYAIAHLKLGLFLEETGYQFESGKRLGVYLLNTLEDIQIREEQDQLSLQLPQLEEIISEEAKQGSKIKDNEPIMVVIGNPPYSYDSQNKGQWISNLVKDYYYIDGKPLGEKNPKGLQDDYVKFIRFAQWKIDNTQKGILSFINNHGFLDNATFRGMRQSLINSFDNFFVYNLNGNANKKENYSNLQKDENVFDIQQGVSINVAFKLKNSKKNIQYGEIFGNREYKNNILENNNVMRNLFEKINPLYPFYLLVPQNVELFEEYQKGWSVKEIFNLNSTGFRTHRDYLVISNSKNKLIHRINEFADLNLSDQFIREKYFAHLKEGKYLKGDTRDWSLSKSRKEISQENQLEKWITICLRRPFDFQWYFYHTSAVEYGRPIIMNQLINRDNIALLWTRPMSPNYEFSVFCASYPVDQSAVGNKTAGAGASYVGPLYVYQQNTSQNVIFEDKISNFSDSFLRDIKNRFGNSIKSEKIFNYIYAMLHSPSYRNRYSDFLKYDFPRVPITNKKQLFYELSDYGQELIELHLMKSSKLDNIITRFTEKGGNRKISIGSSKTAYHNGIVKINKQGDCFTGVPEEVWNFQIGGYQVCHKWLQVRKGYTLSDQEILHYQKIIVSIKETIRLMQLIDEAIPGFPIE